MPAIKGNEYYLIRTTNGRNKKYTPASLKKKANEYFEWVINNPLMETQLVKGTFKEKVEGVEVVKHHQMVQVPKMRTLSIQGFCNFADICKQTFYNYEETVVDETKDTKEIQIAKDFLDVTKKIRGIIENYQLEGAAANFLNHNIISSLLGLVNKQEISGNPEKPLTMGKVTMVIKERKLEE